jgi:hypothetical protein
MDVAVERPDERALRDDLHGAVFRLGVVDGLWGVGQAIDETWPNALVWVAASARDGAPDRYYFRLECSNYPNEPPTGSFWNPDAQAPLELTKRPKGHGRVGKVFRTDWEGGRALYHPFDRLASRSHGDWAKKYPHLVWNRNRTIVDLLSELHGLLNCAEYTGV